MTMLCILDWGSVYTNTYDVYVSCGKHALVTCTSGTDVAMSIRREHLYQTPIVDRDVDCGDCDRTYN